MWLANVAFDKYGNKKHLGYISCRKAKEMGVFN